MHSRCKVVKLELVNNSKHLQLNQLTFCKMSTCKAFFQLNVFSSTEGSIIVYGFTKISIVDINILPFYPFAFIVLVSTKPI